MHASCHVTEKSTAKLDCPQPQPQPREFAHPFAFLRLPSSGINTLRRSTNSIHQRHHQPRKHRNTCRFAICIHQLERKTANAPSRNLPKCQAWTWRRSLTRLPPPRSRPARLPLMVTRPRTEAAASATGTAAAAIAAERAIETEATDAETAAAAATEPRRLAERPPEVTPGAPRVGGGAGAVILADTHVVIEPTETTTAGTAPAVAALAPARLTATALPETIGASASVSATTAATVAAMMTDVEPGRALPEMPPLPGTSATGAPSLSSSWPPVSGPASSKSSSKRSAPWPRHRL